MKRDLFLYACASVFAVMCFISPWPGVAGLIVCLVISSRDKLPAEVDLGYKTICKDIVQIQAEVGAIHNQYLSVQDTLGALKLAVGMKPPNTKN